MKLDQTSKYSMKHMKCACVAKKNNSDDFHNARECD